MIFRQRDDAASDIIAFVLIMFLVVAAIACWMLVVIPGQGTEAENAHNEKVLLEFTDFKKGLDLLWLNDKVGYSNSHLFSLAPSERTSLSTMMYLAPTLGSGMLKVERGTSITLTDTKGGKGGTVTAPVVTFDKGDDISFNLLRIIYMTDNQYAPNYTIVYEGGAVWFSGENGGSYQLISPAVSAGTSEETSEEESVTHLIAVSPGFSQSSVFLGNIPVSLTYQYQNVLAPSYPDWRKINSRVSQVQRQYVEVYTGEKTPVLVKLSDNPSDLDINIGNYWEEKLSSSNKVVINCFGVTASSIHPLGGSV